jgi:hypothetical protein
MAGSMFRKLAVAAAVAGLSLAGAVSASAAPQWTTTGDFQAQGDLTLQTPTGMQFGCAISYTGTADNSGGVARATVRDVDFSDCHTTRPGCVISAMTANAPSSWALEASGSSAPFRLQHTLAVDVWTAGGNCPDGLYFTASGSFGSDFVSSGGGVESYAEFIGESSLSTPFGAASVSGIVGFYPVAGGELELQ